MRRLLFVLIHFFILQFANGQVKFYNSENFALQVKQIDEFIERFNNSDCTLVKNYMHEKYNLTEVNRVDLIKSLFNYSDIVWNSEEVTQFLNDVTQSDEPIFLDFLDDDWYAELDCTGNYKGKSEKFKIILKIEVNEKNQAVRWVIKSVYSEFLKLPQASNTKKTLNPAIHGTDFMGLNVALIDYPNYYNYVAKDSNISQLLLFFNELKNKNLTFKQVDEITYHFLQVKGWIFLVREFMRDTQNSGWLISSLFPIEEDDKRYYKKEKLHIF